MCMYMYLLESWDGWMDGGRYGARDDGSDWIKSDQRRLSKVLSQPDQVWPTDRLTDVRVGMNEWHGMLRQKDGFNLP
jgi:hypothetical protein